MSLCESRLRGLQSGLLLVVAGLQLFVVVRGDQWCFVIDDDLDVFVFGVLFEVLEFEFTEEGLGEWCNVSVIGSDFPSFERLVVEGDRTGNTVVASRSG